MVRPPNNLFVPQRAILRNTPNTITSKTKTITCEPSKLKAKQNGTK